LKEQFKNMKVLFKITTIILIQAMMVGNIAWAAEQSCTLSPLLSIDTEGFRNGFYAAHEVAGVDFEGVFSVNDYSVSENSFEENGESALWRQRLAGWLHNKFFKRFFRIRKILGFIMAGENTSRKISIATTMIMTNLTIDIHLTNIIIKPAILAGCVLSGNFFLVWIVAPLSLCLVGGLVRLIPAVFFRILFVNSVRLRPVGMLINFIPWGLGNFAALLFLKENEPQDLWLAKEMRRLSRLIDKSVIKHADASQQEIAMVEKYSVEIVVAIQDCQSCLNEYNYRRFKIRGTKGYSEEKIRRVITLEDLKMKTLFVNNLQAKILFKLGIVHPGYRKGTRPILLFGNRQSLIRIKEQIKNSGLPRESLQRVYQFDMSGFAEMMKNYERMHQFSFLEEVRAIAEKFIEHMFSETEMEDVIGVTVTDISPNAETLLAVNDIKPDVSISGVEHVVSVHRITFSPLILQSI